MDTLIRSFLEVTTLGPFWTPVSRVGLLGLGAHQLVVVLLLIFDRERLYAWWNALWSPGLPGIGRTFQ